MRSKLLVALLAVLASQTVQSRESFDYGALQAVFAVREDTFKVYAKFPAFLEMKRIVADRMSAATPGASRLSPVRYTLRLIGTHEQATLFVGADWISDGVNVASLSESDYTSLRHLIEERPGKGAALAKLDETTAYWLEQQSNQAEM